jgi:hypothetical protein
MIAELYSLTSFGMGGLAMSFEQTATLRRTGDGAGFDGDWIVTEWAILTTLPVADPQMHPDAMFAVPEWMANCEGSRPSATTALSECRGAIPLVVLDSVVSWKNGPAGIGRIAAAASDGAATMTLNILPDAGGFEWTMSGPVMVDPTPALMPDAFADRMVTVGGITGHEVQIDVRVTPAPPEIVNTLALQAHYDGTAVGPTSSTVPTAQGGQITVTLWGEPQSRREIAGDVTIVAEVERAGCRFSGSWALANILYAAGINP